MRKVLLTEQQIAKNILTEMYGGMGDKVGVVKDYLDSHFSRAKVSEMGENGRPHAKEVVIWLDDFKQPVKALTDVQLFYIIQDEFKNIIADKAERDEFLKDVIKSWYNKKISKDNTVLN